jgi:hypothetical protein
MTDITRRDAPQTGAGPNSSNDKAFRYMRSPQAAPCHRLTGRMLDGCAGRAARRREV